VKEGGERKGEREREGRERKREGEGPEFDQPWPLLKHNKKKSRKNFRNIFEKPKIIFFSPQKY
jgi:hypothetical protein